MEVIDERTKGRVSEFSTKATGNYGVPIELREGVSLTVRCLSSFNRLMHRARILRLSSRARPRPRRDSPTR